MSQDSVAILGAGPAGLTAAYLLSKEGVPVTVFEADPHHVGGLARTVQYKGYCFDIGGHRFFSKSKDVEDLWTEILPDDLLTRPRSSRIYYRGRFYSYPLRAAEALSNLGFLEAARCVLSYFKARLSPVKEPRSFEDWVSNQFGKRLFEIFFKTYTEKVWGMSCQEISADWAAQRIKGLSLKTAILNAILPKRKPHDRTQVVKTLIDSFRYPRKGPGMMWVACAEKIKSRGGAIEMGRRVVGCEYDAASGLWTINHQGNDQEMRTSKARHVLSSVPLRQLCHGLRPRLSDAALQAADSLKYRDFLTVAVILKDRRQFDDNWIYIHDPGVKVGRIQNFKSWSPEMVPDPNMNCLGLEYFCFEGDGLWKSEDSELVELAKTELAQIGLADRNDIQDGCVVRVKKAYPVYDDRYASHVATIRRELEERFPTLHVVGRNGMHKYNNQDHAMMTAMLCVRNILAGQRIYDPWLVNQDAEYIESDSSEQRSGASGLRLVPSRVPKPIETGAA